MNPARTPPASCAARRLHRHVHRRNHAIRRHSADGNQPARPIPRRQPRHPVPGTAHCGCRSRGSPPRGWCVSAAQLLQRLHQLLRGKGHALAHGHRGGFMIDTKGKKGHAESLRVAENGRLSYFTRARTTTATLCPTQQPSTTPGPAPWACPGACVMMPQTAGTTCRDHSHE